MSQLRVDLTVLAAVNVWREFGDQFQWADVAQAILAGCGLVALIWGTLRLRTWFREDSEPDVCDHELLSRLGELHREGELSEEEYRLIKGRLGAGLSGRAGATKQAVSAGDIGRRSLAESPAPQPITQPAVAPDEPVTDERPRAE